MNLRARRWLVRGAWALAFVGPPLLRVAWEGRVELRAADEAAAAGDTDARIIHLGRALRWRLPLGDADERAIAGLLEVADAAEADGDPTTALVACRELRSGLLGSRDWSVPHADVLAAVDARIAALMAATVPTRADEAEQLARLRVASEASPLRASAAELAFVVWMLAAVAFLRRGVDAKGRLQQPAATRLGVLVLASLLAWLWAW
ncbi:MAG: hypothetical protein IPN32_21135 [Deltaproteobacteria bacterium]|nr:hypothetical protein [Deltaproteobacteria bacterium]